VATARVLSVDTRPDGSRLFTVDSQNLGRHQVVVPANVTDPEIIDAMLGMVVDRADLLHAINTHRPSTSDG
jgi:hypothetical protein